MRDITLGVLLQERSDLSEVGITFIEQSDSESFLSYADLYKEALKTLYLLQVRGIKPQDELLLQVEDNKTFIVIFWACILGGIIPVPVSIGKNDDHKQKIFNVISVLRKPFIITSNTNLIRLNDFAKLKGLADNIINVEDRIIDLSQVFRETAFGEIYYPNENDIAFIQFSSGSTGNPKGVILTHKNLILNIKAISSAAKYSQSDSMISWMPLTHDMGMIGFHLNPLVCRINQYIIPTELFIKHPALWIDKTSEHKVTILCSPNFGYQYFLKHTHGKVPRVWNLSNVRIIYNGAEPVSSALCFKFLGYLSAYGLKSNSMCPVYGLAEASLAVTISSLDDEIVTVKVARSQLSLGDKISLQPVTTEAVTFVNVGEAIEDILIRITDGSNVELPAETVGNIEIKGGSITKGYYHNEKATKEVLDDNAWLKTGDVGFFKDNSLYVTGRAKEIIFVNGRNYYSHDVESVMEGLEGIELNKVAVAGFFNPEKQKEEIIIFILYRGKLEKFVSLINLIKTVVNEKVGLVIDKVLPVPSLPKTTSGKLQRLKLVEQYASGHFEKLEQNISHILETINTEQLVNQPENNIERRLVEIWRSVLDVERIDVTQSFVELGGNSLKAAEVVMTILAEFNVDFSFEILYEKKTIRALALEIEKSDKIEYSRIITNDSEMYSPVSASQRRLFYFGKVNGESIAYNMPVGLRIHGNLEEDKLEDSINKLLQQHESLRSSFHLLDEPQIRTHKDQKFSLPVVGCHSSELEQTLKDLVKPFDLSSPQLFKVVLVKTELDCSILFMDFHHIIADGISVNNFINDLMLVYQGETLPYSAQFKDYTAWVNKNFFSKKLELQQQWWENELEENLPVLDLPLDFPRPAIFDNRGQKIEFKIDSKTTLRLRELAVSEKYTLHTMMFALYSILLFKITGQQYFVIGVPVSGRNHPDVKKSQGMFVNNLPVKIDICPQDTFHVFLEKLNAKLNGVFRHQFYPFDAIVESRNDKRDMSRNPVFDTMFMFHNIPATWGNDYFELSRYFIDAGISKFDLSFEVIDTGSHLMYFIEFATRLFKKSTITNIASYFDSIVDQIIVNPKNQLSAISIVSDITLYEPFKPAKKRRFYKENRKTVHQLFDQSARRYPSAIAISYGDVDITFEQLSHQVNLLAFNLRRRQVSCGNLIGVMVDKSPELIISLLGILKSGAGYLPIETGLPAGRVEYIIKDSRCNAIITTDEYSHFFDDMSSVSNPYPEILILQDLLSASEPVVDHKSVNNITDIAYILYTSGTTGRPKGVTIEHRSLANYVLWAATEYVKDEKVCFPLFTSIAFDLTLTSIFTPLATGNKIRIYPEDGRTFLLDRILAENKCEIVKLTPSHLKLLVNSEFLLPHPMNRIKRFIVGGEQLETNLARKVYEKFNGNIEIYNEYGPTEATIGCMLYKFNPSDDFAVVPIGRSATNSRVYILDKFLSPVPVGVKGEIYISGVSVARGYLFNEDLTRRCFVSDPFLSGNRMYKTGDTAYWLDHQNMIFTGRKDQQLKINGYRVELAEIENRILSFKNIINVVVTTRTNGYGAEILCAYFISSSEIIISDLVSDLSLSLPYYMVPISFTRIDSIPLTKNGKVDYAALPANVKEESEANEEFLVSEPERNLLEIFRYVLNNNKISYTDNFFEFGGDSIKAVQIVAKVYEKRLSLTVKDILLNQTVRRIASKGCITAIDKIYLQSNITGQKPLIPIENWFFSQNFFNINFYNQSVTFQMDSNVNISLVEKSFEILVSHHDGLRLNYDASRNIVWYNDKHLERKFDLMKYHIHGTSNRNFVNICRTIKSSFNLNKDLLLKAAIITQTKNSPILFITAHHLVIDGVSWRILMEDFYSIYKSLSENRSVKLPLKTCSLLEWAQSLEEEVSTNRLLLEEEYWKVVSQTRFELPQDYATKDWRNKNVKILSKILREKETKLLIKEAHDTYKTEILVLLTAALAFAMKSWTGCEEFVLEQESHGRHLTYTNSTRSVGWFTTMYPLKVKIDNVESAAYIINEVKKTLKEVPNMGLGFGVLQSTKIDLNRKGGMLSEIRLNYMGQFDQEFHNEIIKFIRKPTGTDNDPSNNITTKLELNIFILSGKLNVEIKYNSKAHKKSTIEDFVSYFFLFLKNLLDDLKKNVSVDLVPSDFKFVDLNQEELNILFS